MPLLPAPALIFALITTLWFGASFAVLAQLLADGSMRDEVHAIVGYGTAAVAGAATLGWLWALYASARLGSPVNRAMQIMYGVTAAAQVATAAAMAGLMGDQRWSEPVPFLLLHAALAALLAALISRSRRRAAAA